jgi:hypothetical protein
MNASTALRAPDVSLAARARSELVEETGMFARQLRQLGSFWLNNRHSAERMRVFIATELEQ